MFFTDINTCTVEYFQLTFSGRSDHTGLFTGNSVSQLEAVSTWELHMKQETKPCSCFHLSLWLLCFRVLPVRTDQPQKEAGFKQTKGAGHLWAPPPGLHAADSGRPAGRLQPESVQSCEQLPLQSCRMQGIQEQGLQNKSLWTPQTKIRVLPSASAKAPTECSFMQRLFLQSEAASRADPGLCFSCRPWFSTRRVWRAARSRSSWLPAWLWRVSGWGLADWLRANSLVQCFCVLFCVSVFLSGHRERGAHLRAVEVRGWRSATVSQRDCPLLW